jgi:acetolactate synthase-1/2/3 large subunit
MKASDLFIRCLEEEGVEYMFGVPGEENADMMISLLDSNIKFIVTRHEQAAAFMADLYGRLTGKPAVCLGTLGPGATNLLTGVADANMDRAPLVVITGQAATKRIHKESHQAMDVVAMFKPVVKWTTTISNADTIPEIIRKAFKVAQTEKMGATHIELPEDIAKHRTLKQPLPQQLAPQPDPSDAAIQKAVQLIKAANYPAILAGNGVLRGRASEALTALVNKTGIPVVNTFMGKGSLAASHPCSVFTVGLQARDYVVRVLEEADVVLAIGYDLVEYPPAAWNHGCEKQIIHIDFTPAEVDESYDPAVDIEGEIRLAIEAITAGLPDKKLVDPAKFTEVRQTMEQEFRQHAEDASFPMKPQKILWEVRKALAQEDILISDVGAHKMWIARYFQCDVPNTCQISNGFCTMGFALPGAIGAKLAFPDRRVMTISGDGGVMMNIQDLETACRLKLPIINMVWTDSQYGLIKWKQTVGHGKHSHIDFNNPDFVKLAESFGAVGYRVEKPEDLPGILQEAMKQDRPVIIDCPVDYSENLKLSRRLGELPNAERSALLKKSPIFSKVGAEYLDVIGDYMQEREYPSGATICEQGAVGDEVFVLVKGEVDVKIRKDGQPEETIRVGPGACFGEMAVLADKPRSATVVAANGGVDTLVLSSGDFNEILLSQPEMGVQLLKELSRRLIEAN